MFLHHLNAGAGTQAGFSAEGVHNILEYYHF